MNWILSAIGWLKPFMTWRLAGGILAALLTIGAIWYQGSRSEKLDEQAATISQLKRDLAVEKQTSADGQKRITALSNIAVKRKERAIAAEERKEDWKIDALKEKAKRLELEQKNAGLLAENEDLVVQFERWALTPQPEILD